MSATEKIKAMMDTEIVARDATAEALKATNDPVAIAGLMVEYAAHCAAVGAFATALEAIGAEARNGSA